MRRRERARERECEEEEEGEREEREREREMRMTTTIIFRRKYPIYKVGLFRIFCDLLYSYVLCEVRLVRFVPEPLLLNGR